MKISRKAAKPQSRKLEKDRNGGKPAIKFDELTKMNGLFCVFIAAPRTCVRFLLLFSLRARLQSRLN